MWFGCIMVRCLVNFAIGPAVKLNQDPHKSQFGLSQEKFEVWPQPTLVYCMGWSWAFFVSQGMGKDNILYTSLQCYSLSQPILRGAYIVTNPWGLFLRDSAIKLQKQSNPPSWAKNWQQMSTNPEDHAHICPQGELTPHPYLLDDHW